MFCASVAVNAQNAYGEDNGHQYVDLGLSVKWATCNIGSNTIEGWGDYFAWGELQTKHDYSKDTYKGYQYSREWEEVEGGGKDADGFDVPLVKKKHKSVTTWPDFSKNISGGFHDIAKAEWGGNWRIPTTQEYQELRKKCTWEWTTKNDVRGYKVTGPNGNWIFLPAAGYRVGMSSNRTETRGYYWTANMPEKSETKPYLMYLGKDTYKIFTHERYMGLSIRAVCEK